MKKPRFRAKRAKYGYWVYGSLITCEDGQAVIVDKAQHPWMKTYVEVNPKTIGQFTGLYDEQGNGIYEGDIIKMSNCSFNGVVQWNDKGYFYINEYYPEVKDFNFSPLGNMLAYKMVVIGNIYENNKTK